MKFILIFFLLTANAFASNTVDISEIGGVIQDEMAKITDLSNNFVLAPNRGIWNFSAMNFRIITSIGVTIPGIASTKLQPEIEFHFSK